MGAGAEHPIERLRAVVVADNASDVDALRAVLDQPGAPSLELLVAADADDARALLQHTAVDAVLLDHKLGAAGAEPTRAQALVDEFGSRFPIVLLAQADDPALVARALRAGAQDVLVRGQFDGPALRCALDRARLRASLVRELDLVRQRFELATEASRDAILEWNLATDEVVASAALVGVLGLRPDELGDRLQSWIERVHPSEQARVRGALERYLAAPLERFRLECRMRHATRGYRLMRLQGRAIIGNDGRAERLVGSLSDKTDARAQVERLRHDAYHDALTGAVTRAVLVDRVRQAVERGRRRPGLQTAVLFIDLDRFKPLNDEHGHAAGDAALVEVVRRLRASLRPADTVARLGGDEFGVLLEDLDGARDAEQVARRILDSLGQTFRLDGRSLKLGASLGLVVVVGDGSEPEELLRRADRAMYHAKRGGNGTMAVWSEALDPDSELPTFELAPQRAVAERQRLAVRPLVELLSRASVGVELAACHGLDVSPRPIDPTGLELLADTLAGASAPVSRARVIDLRVAVSCLASATGVRLLERVMDALAAGAAHVRLALPEDALVFGGGELAAAIRRLRARGHAVLIDDFGQRYAPLALLRRGGLDGVRLSAHLVGPGGDAALVESVVGHCLRRGFELVGTGVDRERAAERLIAVGCAVATGPHLGEPRPLGTHPWRQLEELSPVGR